MGEAVKCPLCGNVEPEVWSEAPMNETIRAYARAYIIRPIVYHATFWEALEAWGPQCTEGLEGELAR